MSVDDELTLAAARLARSAPESWKQFLVALSGYSSQQINYCIQSPLDELPRAQGRAQNSARLYGLLADCIASADKLEGKRR